MTTKSIRCLILALATLAVLLATSSVSEASLSRAECRDGIVADYSGPLYRMQPLQHPPPSGQVRFLPAGLELRRLGAIMFVGAGEVGFALANNAKHRVRGHSGWTAESSLSRVRRSGRTIRTLSERHRSLDSVVNGTSKSIRLGSFRVPWTPAFYRLDLEFRNESGERHRYREYRRVLPHRVDMRLGISSSSVHPGEKLTWRIENYGTSYVSFGLHYRIERLDTSGWILDPLSPPGFLNIGFLMGAGLAGRCQSSRLPVTMRPGRYRVVKPVAIGLGPSRDVSAEFRVVD